MEHAAECDHLGPITDCSFSPDGEYLVASDANRKVILYKVPEFNVSKIKRFKFIYVIIIIYFICNALCYCYWIVGNYHKYNVIVFGYNFV